MTSSSFSSWLTGFSTAFVGLRVFLRDGGLLGHIVVEKDGIWNTVPEARYCWGSVWLSDSGKS